MSTISIASAINHYGGDTEGETLRRMADACGCKRIYKYANDFGDCVIPTDYKRIFCDLDEKDMFTSPFVHNPVLVYDDGRILNIIED